jgi:hypothetical protein
MNTSVNQIVKNNSCQQQPSPNIYFTISLSLLYGSISCLSIFGNILIIIVVVKSKRMHNVTNYFISNLALADVIIGVFAIPFQVILLNKKKVI